MSFSEVGKICFNQIFFLIIISGSELLFQDASGGLTIFNFAQNKTQFFMSNSTFVSILWHMSLQPLCFRTFQKKIMFVLSLTKKVFFMEICIKVKSSVQPWWLGGRVLDNVQTRLMLCFGGSNPAWGYIVGCRGASQLGGPWEGAHQGYKAYKLKSH